MQKFQNRNCMYKCGCRVYAFILQNVRDYRTSHLTAYLMINYIFDWEGKILKCITSNSLTSK